MPDEVEIATKTVLAQAMLARALDAGVPATWVTADEAASPRTLNPAPPDTGRTTMSKRTSKRKTRRKKASNHGKRPNGN